MNGERRSASGPSTVRVRGARGEDLSFLVEANVALARETEDKALAPGVVERGIRAVLGDSSLGAYFVAEIEGEPAGCLMITREWSDWRDGFFWWIQSVYVLPDRRGAGVFRRLYDEVLARGRSTPGVCGVRLYVEKDNQKARAVYETCGMVESPYRLYETELSPDREPQERGESNPREER